MAIQNKEVIRQRMLRTASESWGIQPTELASFDPVVGMILGACASEMEKMYNDLEISQSRVLERLSKLLIPEVNKGPQPSRAVMHASPNETKTVLRRLTQFYYNKKIPAKESSVKDAYRDLYFTPVDDYQLFKAEIKYLAYDDGIYELSRISQRNRVASGLPGKRLTKNELWLAITTDKDLEDLNGIMLYMDWVNVSDISLLLSYLPFTKWFSYEGELNYKPGYPTGESKSDQLEEEFEFDVEKRIFRDIKAYYEGNFVTLPTLELKRPGTEPKVVPEALKDVFGAKGVEKLEKTVWIKIAFPAFVTNPEFDNLSIALNCFPVTNRCLKEISYRIQNNFNIVPLNLEENEYFFSVLSVKSGDGKSFTNSSLKELSKSSTGLYVIRKGGVQRFDDRNAVEYLNNLENLLRDEIAAFQVFGQEMISDNIRALNQMLNQILQRVERSGVSRTEEVNYLIVKPENFEDMIFVEYWCTTGAFGNDIRIGAALKPYSGSEVRGESLMLMTNTTGGRDSLAGSELLENFRHSLITRDRVVTEADIRYFCLKELDQKVSEVEVVKGLQLDSKSKSGFIKTIDIFLVPQNIAKYSKEEWNFICGDIKAKLGSKMSTFLPVNVKIKE